MAFFERYLPLWVALCMAVGVAVRQVRCRPSSGACAAWSSARGSQINVPIAVLIWLMITPMMMKVDFGAIRNVGRKPAGLLVTLFVNWVVKPFSMALLAWFFFRFVFAHFIGRAEADQYIAGCIILAAAPCTAMVFVWSHLTDGDPAYTLVQVSVNDLIMLVAVRAHRAVPGHRSFLAHRAVPRPAVLRDHVHRHSADGGRRASCLA